MKPDQKTKAIVLEVIKELQAERRNEQIQFTRTLHKALIFGMIGVLTMVIVAYALALWIL